MLLKLISKYKYGNILKLKGLYVEKNGDFLIFLHIFKTFTLH
jgi:hypothetical protein